MGTFLAANEQNENKEEIKLDVNDEGCRLCQIYITKENQMKIMRQQHQMQYNDMRINIQTLTGSKKFEIDVGSNESIIGVKFKIEERLGIPAAQMQLKFGDQQLQNDKTLSYYNITKKSILHLVTNLRGGGIKWVEYDAYKQIIVFPSVSSKPRIEIPSFHVSCKSDRFTGEDMAGVVLYSYDDKTDWRVNGIHCKSGYIVLKLTKNISHIKGAGKVHGACYKSVFGVDIDRYKVVGGGFAYFNGNWIFNSWTFNVGSTYHDGEKAMHTLEEQCIRAAANNWKYGIQNTYVKDIANQFKNVCIAHGFY